MDQQTIDLVTSVLCIVSVMLIAWLRERQWHMTVNRYVWRLHAMSGEHMKASLDKDMSESLRTFNHAKALETSRIAKELDLLVLGGAVAHEMWILHSKSDEKAGGENGSENERIG